MAFRSGRDRAGSVHPAELLRRHVERIRLHQAVNLQAPAACVAVRKKMVGYTRQVAALTQSLSGQSKLNFEQYAAKGYQQGLKIDKLGHKLGALTAEPTC